MTEDDEQKQRDASRKVSAAARRLERSPDFMLVWEALKLEFDIGGPAISKADLAKPTDGMTKALIMARSDGNYDIFDKFNYYARFRAEDDNQQKEVEE